MLFQEKADFFGNVHSKFLGKIPGDLCQIKVCVIEDCPFRARCDITVTVTKQNETKNMCAAHLFLLHVLVIIRITCNVYCANLKAKLQFMFILILND